MHSIFDMWIRGFIGVCECEGIFVEEFYKVLDIGSVIHMNRSVVFDVLGEKSLRIRSLWCSLELLNPMDLIQIIYCALLFFLTSILLSFFVTALLFLLFVAVLLLLFFVVLTLSFWLQHYCRYYLLQHHCCCLLLQHYYSYSLLVQHFKSIRHNFIHHFNNLS